MILWCHEKAYYDIKGSIGGYQAARAWLNTSSRLADEVFVIFLADFGSELTKFVKLLGFT